MNFSFIRSAILPLVVLCLLAGACISQRKLEYMQNSNKTSEIVFEAQPQAELRIKSNDELFIKVSSFDDVNFNYFQGQATTMGNFATTELGLSITSYSVSDSGTVFFPLLGNISFKGLTLIEASKKLENSLTPFFDQPTVVVKFAYNKITVMGEVTRPGYYTYTKDQLNLFEALSLANDITVHGNIEKVYVIRTENEEISKVKLDLSDDNILISDYYYMKPGDVVYVAPRRSLRWNVVSTPISLIISTITASILILSYFEN